MILVPSLYRPSNVARLAERAPDLPIYLLLNPEDPLLGMYTDLRYPIKWRVEIAPADMIGACALIRYFFETHPDEDYYAFMGDDCIPPEGKDWHEELVEAAGDWHIAYGDDGHHHDKLCPHPWIGGKLVRAVGGWAPPGLFHGFWDSYWHTIGHSLGLLEYKEHIKFEHLHPDFGTANPDVVYEIPLSHKFADQKWYQDWVRGGEAHALVNWLAGEIPNELQSPKSVHRASQESVSSDGDICSEV